MNSASRTRVKKSWTLVWKNVKQVEHLLHDTNF